MRIPHVFDINTQEAFHASSESVNRVEEQQRKIRPEDFVWDVDLIPSLAQICLQALADNFKNRPCLDDLVPRDRDHIQELISTELPITMTVKLIESEQYWKRRYQAHYSIVPFQTHLGWTWKCVYLEQHIRFLLEQAEPEYKDEETFEPMLKLCASHIHILFITQLQQWKRPNTWLLQDLPKEAPTYHISFIPILQHLPYLVQLEICYGMKNVGTKYDCHMFKLSVEDCENLGEAILKLKHLKILRVHKSEVKCKHVQGLVKKLMYNGSLIELDLSQCRIGNLGAKCIGKMLTVQETLKVLKLTNNLIGEQGIVGITWALIRPEGAHLQVLDLSMNPLGGAGCAMLMRALVRGLSPRDLSLAHCNIHEDAVHYVTCMLLVNTRLQRLDISGNDFGETGGQKLLRSMEKHPGLIELDMRDTKIPMEIQNEIKIFLKRNFDASLPDCNLRSETNFFFIDLLKEVNKEPEIQSGSATPVEFSEMLSDTYNSSSLRNYLVGPDIISISSSLRSIPPTIQRVAFLSAFRDEM